MDEMIITGFKHWTVYDSNGDPALEVEITINNSSKGYGYAPRGSTQGGFECTQLYEDAGIADNKRKGLLTKNADRLKNRLINYTFHNHKDLDNFLIFLDGTVDKSNLGGNLMLAVSIAGIYAMCSCRKITPASLLANENELGRPQVPILMFNLIDGIKHHSTSGLECLLIPCFEESPEKCISLSIKVFNEIEKIILSEYKAMPFVSKQGGWSSDKIITLNQILSCACSAIEKAGFTPGVDFALGLDIAASDLYRAGMYEPKWSDGKIYNPVELVHYFDRLADEFPIVYLEDGLASDDYNNWRMHLKTSGHKLMISGDDLFATNPNRLDSYRDCANTAVIKPNQIGTISETVEFAKKCKEYNLKTVVSQRTSEIEMNIISHIAYSACLNYLKAGGLKRMERVSRFNEIIRLVNS